MSMTGYYRRLKIETLQALRDGEIDILDFIDIPPDDRSLELDIDKAWHGIHFVLNGSEWEGTPPLFNVVLGGEPVNDDDVGHGPARCLMPREVQDVAAALRAIPPEEFRRRYDPALLTANDIYPQIWDDEDERDPLLEDYELLREFFLGAAQAGDALLLCIV